MKNITPNQARQQQNTMKDERNVFPNGSGSGSISGVSPVPAYSTSSSPAPPALPTPSPFSFSIASTRWSSRPAIYLSNLFLRSFALLFSFVSALSIAAPSPSSSTNEHHENYSLRHYPELMYCFIVTTLTFVYSAYQLFKGVCDIAYRGILIPDRVSDYLSFIF